MSYTRFGWDGSDVYVFRSASGIECCGCILQERRWVDDETYPLFRGYYEAVGERIQTTFTDTDEAVAHLTKHIAVGHVVPAHVIPELLADREENERAFCRERT